MAGYSPTMLTIPGDGATLSYFSPARNAREEIFFISDMEATGGEPDETEIKGTKHTAKLSGRPGVPDLAITIVSYVPHHDSWEEILDLTDKGQFISFDLTTAASLVHSSAGTDKVATAQAALGAFVNPVFADPPTWADGDFAIGQTLFQKGANGQYFKIHNFDQAGLTDPQCVVAGKAAIVVATDFYKIYVPQLTFGPFLAKVKGVGSASLPADGALNTSLALTPNSLPKWRVDPAWVTLAAANFA